MSLARIVRLVAPLIGGALALLALAMPAQAAYTSSKPFVTGGSQPGQVNGFLGLASDSAGNVYVMEHSAWTTGPGTQRIQVFSPDGARIGGFNVGVGTLDDGTPLLSYGSGLAVDPGTGDVLVSQPPGVVRYAALTAPVPFARLSAFRVSVPVGEAPVPGPLAVSPSGEIAVAITSRGAAPRTLNETLRIFSPDGTPGRVVGATGSGPGRFQPTGPLEPAFAPNGELYVAAGARGPVQRFAADGTFLGAFGAGPLAAPFRIVVDSAGNVGVPYADPGFAGLSAMALRVFTPEGVEVDRIAPRFGEATSIRSYSYFARAPSCGFYITAGGDAAGDGDNSDGFERVRRWSPLGRPCAVLQPGARIATSADARVPRVAAKRPATLAATSLRVPVACIDGACELSLAATLAAAGATSGAAPDPAPTSSARAAARRTAAGQASTAIFKKVRFTTKVERTIAIPLTQQQRASLPKGKLRVTLTITAREHRGFTATRTKVLAVRRAVR